MLLGEGEWRELTVFENANFLRSDIVFKANSSTLVISLTFSLITIYPVFKGINNAFYQSFDCLQIVM
jgi:hypothetical protein